MSSSSLHVTVIMMIMMIIITIKIIMIRLTNWFQKVETMWRWAARNRSTSLSWLWRWNEIVAIFIVFFFIMIIFIPIIIISIINSNCMIFASTSLGCFNEIVIVVVFVIPAFPCRDRRRSRRCWIGKPLFRACAPSTSGQKYDHDHDCESWSW